MPRKVGEGGGVDVGGLRGSHVTELQMCIAGGQAQPGAFVCMCVRISVCVYKRTHMFARAPGVCCWRRQACLANSAGGALVTEGTRIHGMYKWR